MNVIMKMILKLLLAASIVLPAAVWAENLDCRKADGPTEKTICGTPELSRLDAQMALAYKQALKTAKHPEKLSAGQRDWISYGQQVCDADIGCLREAYQSRIRSLKRHESPFLDSDGDGWRGIGPSSENFRVVFYRDMDVPMLRFNRALADFDKSGNKDAIVGTDTREFNQLLDDGGKLGQVVSCNMVVGVDAPRFSPGAIGGICLLRGSRKVTEVKICQDYIHGNFAVAPVRGNRNNILENLLEFSVGFDPAGKGCLVLG
jgi:uncharacterized protein